MIVVALYSLMFGLFVLFSTEPPLWARILLIISIIVASIIAYVFDMYKQFKIEELEKE